MNKELEKFVEYLRMLDIRLDPVTFESRLKLQKLAYILGELIGKIYLDFSFYIKGPYSKQLATDYYSKRFLFGKSFPDAVTGEEAGKLKELKTSRISSLSANELEIVASLLYLEKNDEFQEDMAVNQLHLLKSYFSIDQIIAGLNELKELTYLQSNKEKLMKLLKSEMEPWEKASTDDLVKFSKTK